MVSAGRTVGLAAAVDVRGRTLRAMASHDRFRCTAPRELRDPDALRARLQAVRTEPTALPLNDWVEKLRGRLGDGESVPRFDPASGGIEARSLFRNRPRHPQAGRDR